MTVLINIRRTDLEQVQIIWLILNLISQAESNMNDLISEYQQYQEATIDDDYDGDGDGEDLEQDEA